MLYSISPISVIASVPRILGSHLDLDLVAQRTNLLILRACNSDGGRHKHGGWTIAFEAMPIVGYCNTWNGYGNENDNWHQPQGGASPYRNCGGSKSRDPIDVAIYRVD